MYVTSEAEDRAKEVSVGRQNTGFVKKKLPFLVHHILICILAYPLTVVSVRDLQTCLIMYLRHARRVGSCPVVLTTPHA